MLTDNDSRKEDLEKNKSQSNRKTKQRGKRWNSTNKSGFKRKFEQPLHNAKRKMWTVGIRLESDLGIIEHIGKHERFSAIIKQRFNDFHVNEIDLDGQVTKLITQDIPLVPISEESIDDLKASVSPTIWEQLQVLKEETFSHVNIDVTNLDKAQRKTIHIIAKRLAKVISQTVDEGEKKIITIVTKTKTYENDFNIRKDDREDWKKRGGEYCCFLLHKVNKDTNEAVNQLALKLRVRPDSFGYAGMKDRRAWTTQWISLKKMDACNILKAAKTVYGVYVGNFRYAKTCLKLGMLNGNRFRIALRNASGTNEEIERAMTSLRDNGFINYYGLQRFGTVITTPTHEIGKYLLQGKWKEAIELILKPRPMEWEKDLAEAKQIYMNTKNPYAAYAKLKRSKDKLEARLLRGLQVAGSKNLQGAFDFIPRNIRLMYIHAYQSLVWNHIVSRRIREFGTNVIVGDLVYAQDCKEDTFDDLTDDCTLDDNNVKDDDDAVCTEKNDDATKVDEDNSKQQQGPRDLPKVKILTEENLSNYSLLDVVMPQPGWKVTYPPYAEAWYNEVLAKDDLTSILIKQKNKKYSLSGAYRKILEIPTNLCWRIMHYKQENDNLLLADIDEVRKKILPQNEPDGKFKALIIEMCLKSSCYATMALREILKDDTSVETHAALSASHSENTSNADTTEELSINDENSDTEADDLDKTLAETGDLEKNSAETGDLEKNSAETGDLEKKSVETDDLEKNSAETGDLEKNSAETGDLEKNSTEFCEESNLEKM